MTAVRRAICWRLGATQHVVRDDSRGRQPGKLLAGPYNSLHKSQAARKCILLGQEPPAPDSLR
jgi:hypothetical protein